MVILSGICGAGFGYIALRLFLSAEQGAADYPRSEPGSEPLQIPHERGRLLAGIMVLGYTGTVFMILMFKIHGD
ncbi:MAG: citrate transporter, partial [Desulfitobacterium hafniense]